MEVGALQLLSVRLCRWLRVVLVSGPDISRPWLFHLGLLDCSKERGCQPDIWHAERDGLAALYL
jgi:hypothetical protein